MSLFPITFNLSHYFSFSSRVSFKQEDIPFVSLSFEKQQEKQTHDRTSCPSSETTSSFLVHRFCRDLSLLLLNIFFTSLSVVSSMTDSTSSSFSLFFFFFVKESFVRDQEEQVIFCHETRGLMSQLQDKSLGRSVETDT